MLMAQKLGELVQASLLWKRCLVLTVCACTLISQVLSGFVKEPNINYTLGVHMYRKFETMYVCSFYYFYFYFYIEQ